MEKKYFFIGDIHGCADELAELLLLIPKGPNDEIICVGDLINKGPDSNRVLDLLRAAGAQSVLGNHDNLVKMIHAEKTEGKVPELPIKEAHYKLYDSLSAENIQFICNLPLWIHIKEINTLVVHAGLRPNLPLEEHSVEELTCLRILNPKNKEYVKRDKVGLPWYFFYTGDKPVIYGHNAARSIKINKNTFGIDTGCLYGHKLTALSLPDNQFYQVKAKTTYVDYTQGGHYKMPR